MNQYFPNLYQPQMPQLPQYTPPQAPQQNNSGLIWVQGEAAAKSYLVAPNNTVMLMDSEGSRFYLKSTDASGMPTMKVYEYKEVSEPQTASQSSFQMNAEEFCTKKDYEALLAKYEALEKLINTDLKKEVKHES